MPNFALYLRQILVLSSRSSKPAVSGHFWKDSTENLIDMYDETMDHELGAMLTCYHFCDMILQQVMLLDILNFGIIVDPLLACDVCAKAQIEVSSFCREVQALGYTLISLSRFRSAKWLLFG